jgi:ABC-type polysaccharide/polyol phosphate transport system ATPase subunit
LEKTVIKVDNIGMEFNLSAEKVDNLKEYVIKFLKRELLFQEFWALKNVSFEVEKGDRVGIIGLNGAGKSTLLKIISGVMKPSQGTVEIKGRIVPLLELGAGFDNDYTGKENIFLNGAILGYSKEFLEEKYDEIVEFSEIKQFINVPIKNYSSGMRARLGFSIATMVEPDILVLDEVLSVGDSKFREKSENRIMSLFDKGITVLFVSHSIDQVKKLCNKAIWLEKGEIKMQGDVEEVCDAYEES